MYYTNYIKWDVLILDFLFAYPKDTDKHKVDETGTLKLPDVIVTELCLYSVTNYVFVIL